MTINEKNFQSYINKLLNQSLSYYNCKKYFRAKRLTQHCINICKKILKKHLWGKQNENYNKVLIFGIFLRGLQDFIDLSSLRRCKSWKDTPELVEKIWTKMWDCKDRLEYIAGCFNSELLKHIKDEINCLEKIFLEHFGKGMYLSAEILTKSQICSICQKEFRSCEHVAGSIYNGVLCSPVARGISFRTGGSIVGIPKDPRCRIWPWNCSDMPGEKNLGTFKAPLMTLFRLDDFMDDKDDKNVFKKLAKIVKNVFRRR